MPLKKNALGPSEAACIEEYKVVSKEDGGWLVTILASTPKVHHSIGNKLCVSYWHKLHPAVCNSH